MKGERLPVLRIDEAGERLGVALIADMPVGSPGQLPPGRRPAGLRHARETEINAVAVRP